MRRFIIATMVSAVAVAFAQPANAGALSLLQNGINVLEDDDYETFVDVDGDGTIEIGDFVVGMIVMQTVNGQDTSNFGATFEAILVAQIVDISGTTLEFGAVSASDYADLQDGTIASFDNLPTRMSDASAVIVFNDETQADLTPSFVNPDGAGTGDAGVNDALLTAQTDELLFEFGFADSIETSALEGDAYSESTVNSLTLANVNTLDFIIGLNLTYNGTANVQFMPVLNPADLTRSATDIVGAGNEDLFNPRGDFDIKTDSDFLINVTVVPEPTSMALFGIGVLALAGAGLRRRRMGANTNSV